MKVESLLEQPSLNIIINVCQSMDFYCHSGINDYLC